MITITPEFVKKYVHENYRHEGYEKCCELYESMEIHADGLFPEKLIGTRRPSESKAVFTYRKIIYESPTQSPFSKIQNSLAKIRKSQDFVVQWDKKKIASKIAEEETLENYCDKNFPIFNSVTDWTFSVLLKQYLVDPNSVMIVLPQNLKPEAGEYFKPIPTLFCSEQVIDFIPGELAVLTGDKKVIVEGQKEGKDVYYFFTKNDLWVAKPDEKNGEYTLTLVFKHDLDLLPARILKAVFEDQIGSELIYKSRLFACLPSWNEASREYSDMQATVMKHMHNTMVIHTNQKCPTCNGSGKTLSAEGKGTVLIPCTTCGGKGGVPDSPYEDITVHPQKAGEIPLPSPIAYEIARNPEIIKIQDERIDKHLYRAFGAVNFEFLGIGLNQSGIAKEWDRSEANTFVDNVAEDLVSIMDSVYYFSAVWRYKFLLSDTEIKDQLPHIPVPQKYDIVTENYLAEQLEKVKTIGANPFLVAALEVEYAEKKFNTNKPVNDLIKLSILLDPLSGVSQADKDSQKMNGGVTEENYVISCMINFFIKKAIAEDEKFMDKKYEEQMIKMQEYAQAEIKTNSEAAKIKAQIDPVTGLPIKTNE